jgi:glycosyltransferase involved in cell wall biosynthesis
MRILHALSQRPEATGSGIYVRAMVREAFRAGHENFLLAGVPSGDQPQLDCLTGDQCSFVRFETGGLPFPVVGMSDVMPYPSRRFSDLTAADLEVYEACFAERLDRAVKDFQPDLIHSHHLWLLTALIKRSFPKIPVVTTCHGSDLRQFQKCVDLQPRIQSGCAGLEGIMALSQAQKREIIRLYGFAPDQVTVVGVGYHQEIFRAEPKPLPPPIEMVFAGKLSRAKGVPWMLRALSEVSEAPWRLHLIGGGEGPEKEEALTLAESLGDRVQVHGLLPQETLAEIFRGSHLLILPSFYEGLALVLLEALACDCRLVSTNFPGLEEVLGELPGSYCRLVELPRLKSLDTPFPEDEASFEGRLAAAIRDQIKAVRQEPKMNPALLAPILEAYSWTRVFERVEQVYIQALNRSLIF